MAEEDEHNNGPVCNMVAEGQDSHYHNMCMSIIMELLCHVPDKQTAAVIAESTLTFVCMAHGLHEEMGLDAMVEAVRERLRDQPQGVMVQ